MPVAIFREPIPRNCVLPATRRAMSFYNPGGKNQRKPRAVHAHPSSILYPRQARHRAALIMAGVHLDARLGVASNSMLAPAAPSSSFPPSSTRHPLGGTAFKWLQPRNLVWAAWIAFALIPVFYVLAEVVQSSRNVVYWDEFDTALAFVLRLEEGVT
ncbi:MAG: hypothetical protein Q7S40_21035, partial [Opitutaceae bacterium]|nr:hypothetical protein [Opitutaceae bacterium]